MEILYETKSIFDAIDEEKFVAHAISGDYVMGMGLAQQLNEKYDLARKLFIEHDYDDPFKNVGKALLVDNVFNLTVKPKYRHTVRAPDVVCALHSLRQECEARAITDIYMPKICCGRTGLDWNVVSQWIADIFNETEINMHILVPEGGNNK